MLTHSPSEPLKDLQDNLDPIILIEGVSYVGFNSPSVEWTLHTVPPDCSSDPNVRPQMRTEGVKHVDHPFLCTKYSHSGAQKVETFHLLPLDVLGIGYSVPKVVYGLATVRM